MKRIILLLIVAILVFLTLLAILSKEKAEVSAIELDAKWPEGGMLCSSGPMMNMLEGKIVACDSEKCVIVVRTWIFSPVPSAQQKNVEIQAGNIVKIAQMQRRGSYMETNPFLMVVPPGTGISIRNTSLSFTVPSCLKERAKEPPIHIVMEGNASQDWGTIQFEEAVIKFKKMGKSVLLLEPSSDLELDISGKWGSYSFKAPSGRVSLVVLPGSFSAFSSGREILKG